MAIVLNNVPCALFANDKHLQDVVGFANDFNKLVHLYDAVEYVLSRGVSVFPSSHRHLEGPSGIEHVSFVYTQDGHSMFVLRSSGASLQTRIYEYSTQERSLPILAVCAILAYHESAYDLDIWI